MVVSHWLQVVGSLLLLKHVEIFLLPAGHVSWDECYVHENSPFMASWLHFKLDFLDSFSCFPLLIKIFLRKHHWLSIRLFLLMEIFLSVCVFWCLEGPFPGVTSHMRVREWGLSSEWKPWRPHLSNREDKRRGSHAFPIHRFISYQVSKH